MGILENYFCMQVIENCSTVSFKKKAELLKSANLRKASFDDVIKSPDHFVGHLATINSILMNRH